MDIKELLRVAKETKVTTKQIDDLYKRLQKRSNSISLPSKEFLSRTYRI